MHSFKLTLVIFALLFFATSSFGHPHPNPAGDPSAIDFNNDKAPIPKSAKRPPFLPPPQPIGDRCAVKFNVTEQKIAEAYFVNKTAEIVAPTATVTIYVYWYMFSYYYNRIYYGDLPMSTVNSQIAVLNSAYAPHGFNFVLAGVARIATTRYFGFDITMQNGWNIGNEMKSKYRSGNRRSLNLYSTMLGGGILGYATFPNAVASYPRIDGIVFDYGTVPGGYIYNFNYGKTLVHELGHWLGLYHTFEGFGTGNGCLYGDSVSDTPAEKYASNSGGQLCPIGRDTCPTLSGKDPVTNYMDYSADWCMNNFTPGQGTRMRQQWAVYRA